MSDPLVAEAVAALARGHSLFAGGIGGGGVGDGPATMTLQADRLAQTYSGGGLPAGAVVRSGMTVDGLRALARTDGGLAEIVNAARADREGATRASRVILDAARADSAPAADTPMGQRELMRRMVARLRAQHGIVVRSRSQAQALALRLHRLMYLRQQLAVGAIGASSASANSGSPAVRAAISAALTKKGIVDPRARARWARGMELVAQRESGNEDRLNTWDSNAAKGTPSGGVFQFIKPTFDSYYEPGTPRSWRNTFSQAAAFINYAMGRYGVAADGSNLAARIQQADPTRPPKGY